MSEIKNIRSRRKCPVSLLWISLLLVGFASSIFAAKDYSIETIPNVRLSNRLNHVFEVTDRQWMEEPRMTRHVSINY